MKGSAARVVTTHTGGVCTIGAVAPLTPSLLAAWGWRGRWRAVRCVGLAEGLEGGAEFLGEELGLFPGGEVAAAVQAVVVDEVGRVGAFGPAAGGLIQLVGEHADGDGDGDGDGFGVKEPGGVLPIQAGGGDPGVGQPVQGDVVQQVVAGEVALQGSLEDLGDQAGLAGPIAMVSMNAARSTGESASPYRVWGRVPMIWA
jgi:hypothetical protein